MYAEFVLDTTHVNASVALVIDEHREATAVACACFAACKHQMDVAVAVRNEALCAVQTPAVVLLVEGCLEHHALQVAAGIRLGQVHRHCLALTYAGNVLLSLFLVAKAIERLDAVLQAPDVLEASIAGRDNLVRCGIDCDRQVQATIAARHRHAVHACLNHGVEVLVGLRSISDATLFEVRPLGINSLSIGSHNVRHDVAHDVQHLVIRIHRIRKVLRSLVVLVFILVLTFLELNDALHQRTVLELELNLIYVVIIVCHVTLFL